MTKTIDFKLIVSVQVQRHHALPHPSGLPYPERCPKNAFGAKTQLAEEFRKLLSQLALCELPENQNANILIRCIMKIIETDYAQNGLCLSSIADELGLSTRYVG